MKTRTPLQSACKQYEEDLVLHYYGDNSEDERSAIERHLGACDACRGFLDDLRKVLPQTAQVQEMPPLFWENYYRETVSKLAGYEERKNWWRNLLTPMRSWMVPAFGTLAAAVLVIGLTLSKDDLRPFAEPRMQKIPQEILADKNQLDFFESMDILEALSKLERQEESNSATPNGGDRAGVYGRVA